ncbi:hypothetical protein GLW08_13470 [Pontibacillus yanchengensis]|uniref:Uncharacterized protein n=1 Tax=Pontibacillus yanchengensis TaxID=462910 RepID=A0ACC7VK72_9BACI|nr:hypothetical protein [Pontibacillus yanchengensis]MYL54339.1 hypothetical protein [Pontibacillus yanchengensis]
MFRKECSYCRKSSFGSDDRGEWVCPYCSKDLTLQSVLPTHVNPDTKVIVESSFGREKE